MYFFSVSIRIFLIRFQIFIRENLNFMILSFKKEFSFFGILIYSALSILSINKIIFFFLDTKFYDKETFFFGIISSSAYFKYQSKLFVILSLILFPIFSNFLLSHKENSSVIYLPSLSAWHRCDGIYFHAIRFLPLHFETNYKLAIFERIYYDFFYKFHSDSPSIHYSYLVFIAVFLIV